MALFGKKKRTLEEVAAELKKPVWWVSRSVAKSTPSNTRTKKNITRIFGEKIDEQTFDTIYSESKSPLHEQKAIYEATPTLVAHELAREIIPYLIVKKTGNKYTKEIGRAVMIAIENSLKRREETPEAIDEERFAGDVVRHLSKHFIIKDPEKTKRDLVKVLRAIKDYSSTLLSIDPIEEEQKANVAHTHLEADIDEPESSDSYLEKNAPEVFEKWWKLKTTIAEVLGTKPYRHEIKKKTKTASKKKTAGRRGTKKESTKIITQKIPSEVEEAFKTLKGIGVDLKLETGNVAERKAKIYAWMVQNGLIRVEQDGEKVKVVPTEKMHQLIAKHGKAAGAILKWAGESGASLTEAEAVADVLLALEGLAEKNPELAKVLEKAMTRKTAIKELNLLVSGLISVDELSELWNVDFRELLKNEKLKSAIIKAMRNAEKSGLASPEVPAEWVPFLEKLKANSITEEDLRKALNLATVGRMVFSALESVAIRGLPGEAEKIEGLLLGVLKKTPDFLPFEVEINEKLEEELRELALVLALMKDESYIERLEEKVAPIIERIPETRKVGLFRRDSPRKKVEDFVALVMSDKLTEEEMEKKSEELRGYLREYLSEEEITQLIEVITLSLKANTLLKAYRTAEDFLFAYAHARASRYLTVEIHIMEALKRGSYEGLHDGLVKALSWIPSLRKAKITLKGHEKTRRLLG